MRRETLTVCAVIALTGYPAERSTVVAQPVASTIVFDGARVIVGDGTAPIDDAVMVVEDGKLTRVGRRGDVAPPSGATHIALQGKTVMPMLMNVHGHVGYMKGNNVDPKNYNRENLLEDLRRYVYYGVAAVLSLGTDRGDLELRIRAEQRSGSLKDPSLALLLTANDGIVAPNPGSTNGGPGFAADVVREAGTPEEARRHVQELAKKKPGVIKLWVDDRNHTKPKLKPEVYRAVVEEAHAQGLRAIAHIYYLDDAKDLAKSGVDGFAHPVRDRPIDEELVRLMKEHDVFQCSTVGSLRPDRDVRFDDPALAETVPPEVRTAAKVPVGAAPSGDPEARHRMYAMVLMSLKMQGDAGIRIALCGDTGITGQFPGFSEHRELQAMVDAGLTPLQAIRAGTEISAAILGLRDMGTLASGKRADFLVLDANPVDNIANTRKIAAVYRGGQAIERAASKARWTGASDQ